MGGDESAVRGLSVRRQRVAAVRRERQEEEGSVRCRRQKQGFECGVLRGSVPIRAWQMVLEPSPRECLGDWERG
jgi:hypothetical protein